MAKTPPLLNNGAEDVAVDRLVPHPFNVNEGDYGAVEESIRVNGFFGRLVVNRRNNRILAGNHRYYVAVRLGFKHLPVEWIDVDEEQEKRILLADNRTARLGKDNEAKLATMLAELHATETGLNGTGFDGDDLDRLLEDLYGEKSEKQPEPLLADAPQSHCPNCGCVLNIAPKT